MAEKRPPGAVNRLVRLVAPNLVLTLVVGLLSFTTGLAEAQQNAEHSGPVTTPQQRIDLSTMAVAPGYRLDVDSVGYDLPTAIAVIPEPFAGDAAPLYFVAELQGTIKVVTRDRNVHDFARVPTWGQQGHDLDGNSQQGLAGLCLAPEHGYLFATFTEPDSGGVMRNRIVRFTSTPGGYALEPSAVTALAHDISTFQSAPAHQIGNCIVAEGHLLVGVGDGGNPKVAEDPAILLGKILCLTFDGEPCPDSPFAESGPTALVYATGFRNPFGLNWHEGGLHAIENGVNLDRFLSVERGRDHLWNGTDEAIASLADVIFPNPFAPVQLGFVPDDARFMAPSWVGSFVASGYGSKHVPAGVAAFGGETSQASPAAPPRYLIEYLGPSGSQHFAGVAVGPDGIYVTPMLPLDGASGAVLRLSYDPLHEHHPQVTKKSGLFRSPDLDTIIDLGCTGCHAVAGTGGGIGPNLDRFGIEWRITEFLNSAAYESAVAALPADDGPRNASRREVLAASGAERTWVWVKEMLLDPRFDDPARQMPDLDLSASQAEEVRAELFNAFGLQHQTTTVASVIASFITRLRDNLRPLLAGVFVGALGMLVLMVVAEQLLQRRRVGVTRQVTQLQEEQEPAIGDTQTRPA